MCRIDMHNLEDSQVRRLSGTPPQPCMRTELTQCSLHETCTRRSRALRLPHHLLLWQSYSDVNLDRHSTLCTTGSACTAVA